MIPGSPTNVTVVPGYNGALVYWTAPDFVGKPILTSYTVTSNPGAVTITTKGAETYLFLPGLTNNKPYAVTVHATNVEGDSLESIQSKSFIPAVPTGTHPTLETGIYLDKYNGVALEDTTQDLNIFIASKLSGLFTTIRFFENFSGVGPTYLLLGTNSTPVYAAYLGTRDKSIGISKLNQKVNLTFNLNGAKEYITEKGNVDPTKDIIPADAYDVIVSNGDLNSADEKLIQDYQDNYFGITASINLELTGKLKLNR